MKVYLIGIGGIGMSYAARWLKHEGHDVSGCDMTDGPLTQDLRLEGIDVAIGHDATRITDDLDMVLVSPAILGHQPEDMVEATNKGIPVLTWQEYIGSVTKDHFTIAVCGAHGKSTTTAMIGVMMQDAGLDPTVMVGTKVPQFQDSNLRLGRSKYLIIEADEFNENFLHYHPDIIVCTSYEVDHLDYYHTQERYHEAFVSFFSNLKEKGSVVYHRKDQEVTAIMEQARVGSSVEAEPLPFLLNVIGRHNAENAALAAKVGELVGLPNDAVKQGLLAFSGTWRRQEFKGEYEGAKLFDDYAHHPTEIKAALNAFREAYPNEYITAVFQPHQYSRTLEFFMEFASSFKDADEVLVTDIYASRDSDEVKAKVSSKLLVEEMKKHHSKVQYTGNLEQTLDMLISKKPTGIILTLGAGSITTISDQLASLHK